MVDAPFGRLKHEILDTSAVAQILYGYPPDKAVSPEVVSFCFPHDVQPSLLERTPSMSALNELIYSQQYQHDDAVSFVFLLKVRARRGGVFTAVTCVALSRITRRTLGQLHVHVCAADEGVQWGNPCSLLSKHQQFGSTFQAIRWRSSIRVCAHLSRIPD